MKRALFRFFLGLPACVLMLGAATVCRADSSFDVNLNTSPLTSLSGHTFSLDFQFNDGSPIGGNGNNTVTLSNFVFGVGSVTPGTIFTTGGVSGSPASGLTLTDSSFLNEFTQDFTPGSLLGFHVNLTTNVAPGEDPGAGGTPDEFSFAILDNGAEISADPSGALLLADVSPSSPVLQTFAAGSAYGNIAPTVTTSGPSAVPEPQTWATGVLGMGLLGLAFAERRGRSRRRATRTRA